MPVPAAGPVHPAVTVDLSDPSLWVTAPVQPDTTLSVPAVSDPALVPPMPVKEPTKGARRKPRSVAPPGA